MLRKLAYAGVLASCFSFSSRSFQRQHVRCIQQINCALHTKQLSRPQSFVRSTSTSSSQSDEIDDENRNLSDIARRVLSDLELDIKLPEYRIVSAEHQLAIQETRQWVKDWVIRKRLCPWAASVFSDSVLRIKVIDVPNISTPEGMEELVLRIVVECTHLAQSLEKKLPLKTTLLVLPGLTNFDDFLDVVAIVEDLLPDTPTAGIDTEVEEANGSLSSSRTSTSTTASKDGNSSDILPSIEDENNDDSDDNHSSEKLPMAEVLQVATFHPEYIFGDATSHDAVENFTNRSPHPIIHLLPVQEVKQALKQWKAHGHEPDDIWKRNIALMQAMDRKEILETLANIRQQAALSRDDPSTTSSKENPLHYKIQASLNNKKKKNRK